MHMESDDSSEHIRKGPWKAEEDEVLLNHVKKYGPREWSSIRTKGLLQRTGKSCRLRWVNKLRPNLKNGCKFSLEEERVVIELQAQFGNKWAKIASHLPGRTDNDVKNFWSSRQKRLARIFQTSPSSVNSKSKKSKTQVHTFHGVPTLEAPKFSSSSEEDSSLKAESCSSFCNNKNPEIIKMVPLPDLTNPKLQSSQHIDHVKQEEFNPFESHTISTDMSSKIDHSPQISQLHQTDLTFSMEIQDLLDRIYEPKLFDVFGGPLHDAYNEFGIAPQLPIGFKFFEPLPGSCRIDKTKDAIDNATNSDSFFDDFPDDMFDQMEPPPSPAKQ